MKQPLFSIIIAAYNAEQTIRNTINSVLIQTCEDYEIVVKDACSKDKTIDQIPEDKRIRVISEEDRGVYDGMNQAITRATGEYLAFLNCGDIFVDEYVLEKVKDYILSEKERYDIIYGDYTRADLGQCVLKQPSNLNAFELIRKPLTHQSVFFNYRVFEKNGLYDLDYKLCADYDLTVKAFLSGDKFLHINKVICVYQGGGISERNSALLHLETKKIRKQFQKKVRAYHFCYQIITLLVVREWIVSDKSPKGLRILYRNILNKLIA